MIELNLWYDVGERIIYQECPRWAWNEWTDIQLRLIQFGELLNASDYCLSL